MNCRVCGSPLVEGAQFCHNCGASASPEPDIRCYCRNCGKKIPDDSAFCPYCGAPQLVGPDPGEPDIEPVKGTFDPPSPVQTTPPTPTGLEPEDPVTLPDRFAAWVKNLWHRQSGFTQISVVAMVFSAILLLVALGLHAGFAIFLACAQLLLEVIGLLIEREVLNPGPRGLHILALILVIPLSILYFNSFSGDKPDEAPEPTVSEMASTPLSSADCFGSDCRDVLNAFLDAGFTLVQTEPVKDLTDTQQSELGQVISVSLAGAEQFRAGEPMDADTPILIRYHDHAVCRVQIHVDVVRNRIFNRYDLDLVLDDVVIDQIPHGVGKDLEMELEPGSHTIAFKRTGKGGSTEQVVLNLDTDLNLGYRITCKREELILEELYVQSMDPADLTGVMIPTSPEELLKLDAEEAAKLFAEAGFTNVQTEPLYDIYLGFTSPGTLEKVTVDGSSDFRKGELIPAGTPVILTYHEKVEKDPGRQ